MVKEILLVLSFCAFMWVIAVRVFTGEWFWVEWKRKKEREKKFEEWRERELNKAKQKLRDGFK